MFGYCAFAWLLVFFWWLCYGLVALPFCLLFGLFAGWIWLLLWVLSIVYVFADEFAWSDSSCVVVIMVDSAIWVAVCIVSLVAACWLFI